MKANLSDPYLIIEKLEYNYLVNNDIYSLNTLMSLLHDKNFINFSKKSYYIKEYCLKNLKKYFWNLRDIDQIIDYLESIMSDDINRYEYIISIKAQFRAFRDKRHIDRLEYAIIEKMGVNFLIESSNLSYNRDDPSIIDLSYEFKKEIYDNKNLVEKLKKDVKNYADLTLKSKIYNIDINTHKQLSFDTDYFFTEDITTRQAKKMYEKSINYLYKSVVDTYSEYYYRGLVREVFKRYQ